MKKTYKQNKQESATGANAVKTDLAQLQQYVKQLDVQITRLREIIRGGRVIS